MGTREQHLQHALDTIHESIHVYGTGFIRVNLPEPRPDAYSVYVYYDSDRWGQVDRLTRQEALVVVQSLLAHGCMFQGETPRSIFTDLAPHARVAYQLPKISPLTTMTLSMDQLIVVIPRGRRAARTFLSFADRHGWGTAYRALAAPHHVVNPWWLLWTQMAVRWLPASYYDKDSRLTTFGEWAL